MSLARALSVDFLSGSAMCSMSSKRPTTNKHVNERRITTAKLKRSLLLTGPYLERYRGEDQMTRGRVIAWAIFEQFGGFPSVDLVIFASFYFALISRRGQIREFKNLPKLLL